MSIANTSKHRTDAEIADVVASICGRYGIKEESVFLKEMGGVNGGLGNAIPLALPFRRIYIVRFHRCIRQAGTLELRGLFAHELMHVTQYSRADYLDLLRFMARYTMFSLTARCKKPIACNWVRSFEHLTDLMAAKYGEGKGIAAWKRFKAEATAHRLIKDPWDHLYLSAADIESLLDNDVELDNRIQQCVTSLGAASSPQPFARNAP